MLNHSLDQLSRFEKIIGYSFNEKGLLSLALTHSSFTLESQHPEGNNQRLEFLGDSVLGIILADHLFHTFPNEKEGVLARYRSALGKGVFLTRLAKKLHFQDYIRVSNSELKNKGQARPSTLEDAIEAVIGAIYIDSNLKTCKEIVISWYGDFESDLKDVIQGHNPKGQFQEWLTQAAPGAKIAYQLVSDKGPGHKKSFTVELLVDDKRVASATSTSKKKAEELAAQEALTTLKKEKEG